MILAGRPYHVDPEICHGIDKLAATPWASWLSARTACASLRRAQQVRVLKPVDVSCAALPCGTLCGGARRTYELVQLVSFGCGIDAITTDEVRSILGSRAASYYTQIKIDEITNLGAVKIRLRSLIGALEESEELI